MRHGRPRLQAAQGNGSGAGPPSHSRRSSRASREGRCVAGRRRRPSAEEPLTGRDADRGRVVEGGQSGGHRDRARTGSAGRPAAPGWRPRPRAAGARPAGRAAPSARPRPRSPRACPAPSSSATSMRESSCRDQWSCRATSSASRSPYAAASSAFQGRAAPSSTAADHAEEGRAAVGGRSVVMASTLGTRAPPDLPPRGGSCAPRPRAEPTPGRLRPGSDVRAGAAALPSAWDC